MWTCTCNSNKLMVVSKTFFTFFLEEGITEDKVARYMSSILYNYFPVTKFAIVPESRTSDKKIPDFVVEEFLENSEFRSRIYVELKSKVGKSIPKAIEQLATSVFLRFGDGPTNEGYLVVVRGSKIAFLEYFAYIDKDEKECFLRIIPFNRKIPNEVTQANRPAYKGESRYKYPDQCKDTYVLDVEKDSPKVHEVFLWMKNNKLRDISSLINDLGFIRSTPSSRVSSYYIPTTESLDPAQSPSTPSGSTNLALFPPPPPPEEIRVKKTRKHDSMKDLFSKLQYDEEKRIVPLYFYPGTRSFSIMEVDEK